MSFLPTDYKSPAASNGYMKLIEGENKFRILSKPIIGWEDWDNKKPVRFEFHNKPTKSIDPNKAVRHFWSFIVWNYNEEKIQILHVTQASIRKGIESLCMDSDWREPFFYDIKIVKKGEGIDTDYTVSPTPHKELAPHIEVAFRAKPCCLHYLFTNDDPFACSPQEATPGVFEKTLVEKTPAPTIEEYQVRELLDIVEGDHEYVEKILGHYKINDLHQLPASQYVTVYERAKNHSVKVQQNLGVPF